MILSYLSVNSVRNKCDDLREITKKNSVALGIAEAKIHSSFPSVQVFLEVHHSTYRIDISHESDVLLAYVKTTILSKVSLPEYPSRRKSCTFWTGSKKIEAVINISIL